MTWRDVVGMAIGYGNGAPLESRDRTAGVLGRVGARLADSVRDAGRRLATATQRGFPVRVVGELETRDGLTVRPASMARGERAGLSESRDEVWVVLRGHLRLTGVAGVVTAGAAEMLHVPENTPGHVDADVDTEMVRVSVAGP